MVGDAAAFVDPLFSTGVLLAVNGAKFAAAHLDAALTDGDFGAERFAPYQEQCHRRDGHLQEAGARVLRENLRKLLLSSAHNPTVCSVITSILAGDVYKPSIWHSIVKSQGFSHTPRALVGGPAARSSRETARPRDLDRSAP